MNILFKIYDPTYLSTGDSYGLGSRYSILRKGRDFTLRHHAQMVWSSRPASRSVEFSPPGETTGTSNETLISVRK
jgi:hypothetical protein